MNNLHEEVKRHGERLCMTQTQLSKAIGKSKNYLSEMINRGCSKEKEREIIALLNDLKSDYEIIAELSQRLADAQDQCIALRAETSRLYAVLSDSKRELEEARGSSSRTRQNKINHEFLFSSRRFYWGFYRSVLGMNIERQKKDEIPEGATHYNSEQDQYFCLEDGLWFKLVNGAWWHTGHPQFHGLITL